MRYLVFIGALLLVSCIKTEDDVDAFAPKFVLEGSIEDGDFPIVQLMHNIPSDFVIDTAQLEELVVRWATVTVTGEGEREILTLVRDKDRFPYFFYKGRKLKGKAGGRYSVEVNYSDILLSAVTEIPLRKPKVDSVWYENRDADEKQPFFLVHTASMSAQDNYLFSSKSAKASGFIGNKPMGLRGQDIHQRNDSIPVIKSLGLMDEKLGSKYYSWEEQVDIKLTNVSHETYQLWINHAQQSLQYSLLNYSSNFRGNISGPGVGMWYGGNSIIIRSR